VVARSKAWVWGQSLARIAGSNPTGSMSVSCEYFCVAREKSLRRADPSSRGVLHSVCVLECDQVHLQSVGGSGETVLGVSEQE